MTWKMATSFVMTAETWLGAESTRAGDEALLVIGVSPHERLAALQRIRRGEVVGFSDPMCWHPTMSTTRTLPGCRQAAQRSPPRRLARIFDEDGEMAAEHMS